MSSSISHVTKCLGTSRNITHLYKKARVDEKKSSRFSLSTASNDSGRAVLLSGISPSHIPLEPPKQNQLPPLWVDSYDKVIEDLKTLEDKLKLLKQAQTKRLKITFGDPSQAEREILILSQEITKLMRDLDGFIHDIVKSSGTNSDITIRKNIQQQLAQKLQEFTQHHKTMQRVYMEKYQQLQSGSSVPLQMPEEDEIEDDYGDNLDQVYEISKARDEGINGLVNNLNELAMIFKDLSNLVVNQGTILDRIDYNLELASDHTKKGVVQLQKAEKHQRCTRATSCIMFLIVMIVLLALVFIFKNF
ncbi:STX16_2 [Blepharisma stoltei]|uniref:t-SNARE coiled-coil homology domain-containing protein n=1 Tax=Blepharisma stoltei TaxID=1481888 RepID=A0AAU9J6Z5_9CILI|nr:unnamed protein product [Blepharisma stoltei]